MGAMKFIPPEPAKKTNRSETKLFESMQGQGSELDWTVIHSVLIGRNPDVFAGEADFYVLIPNKGIVAIEAKAPKEVLYKSGEWYLDGTPKPSKNPLEQANIARASMRQFLDLLGINYEVPIARLVWFTSIDRYKFDPESGGDFQFHEWELAWKSELSKAPQTVEKVLDENLKFRQGSKIIRLEPEKFTKEVVEQIASKVFAEISAKANPEDEAKERRVEQQKLLQDQIKILDYIEDNQNIYIEGPAGSGKSFLIAEFARRAKNAGTRTLVTCWSVMMAEELRKMLLSSNSTNFVIQDVNSLMLDFANLKENPKDADSEWFEKKLPGLALGGLRSRPFLGRFSTICIDEFQDLVGKDKVLEFVLALAKTGEGESQIVLAGDERQQILVEGAGQVGAFETAKSLIPFLVKVKSRNNTRMNPKLHREMCELLEIELGVTEHLVKSDKSGGLEVIATSPEKQAKVLQETLQELMGTYAPEEIRILSPFGSGQSLIGKLFESQTSKKEEIWLKANARHETTNGKIRWRSIRKFKGLESEVVVITDIGQDAKSFLDQNNHALRDWLYVGISRARHRCVVIATAKLEELLK